MAEKLSLTASEDSIWNFPRVRKTAPLVKGEKTRQRGKRKGLKSSHSAKSGPGSRLTQLTLQTCTSNDSQGSQDSFISLCAPQRSRNASKERAQLPTNSQGSQDSLRSLCSPLKASNAACQDLALLPIGSQTSHGDCIPRNAFCRIDPSSDSLESQSSVNASSPRLSGLFNPILVSETPPIGSESPIGGDMSLLLGPDLEIVPETPPHSQEGFAEAWAALAQAVDYEPTQGAASPSEESRSQRTGDPDDTEGSLESTLVPVEEGQPEVTIIESSSSDDECCVASRKTAQSPGRNFKQTSIETYFGGAKPKGLKQMNLKFFLAGPKQSSQRFVAPTAKEKKKEPRAPRKCPFYKWIAGTEWTVDAFRFGAIPGCTGYFLTHFHYDHYGGLSRHFNGKLYCSKITANLVAQQIKVSPESIHEVALDQTFRLDNAKVTFLDANHCPGAAMILFELPSGVSHLHTGDFRASTDLCRRARQLRGRIAELYLDTTYCDPAYSFPPQEEVIYEVVAFVRARFEENPRLLITCGSYSIGKERIFIAIAEALECKVFARTAKRRLLSCFESTKLDRLVSDDPSATPLHVVPMAELKTDRLLAYRKAQSRHFNSVLALRPTGWSHKPQGHSGGHISLERKSADCEIFGVPYSEHSSFSELRNFVRAVRPKRILPTVNMGSAAAREKMNAFFEEWLQDPADDS